jgi:hypothetical protein
MMIQQARIRDRKEWNTFDNDDVAVERAAAGRFGSGEGGG